MRGLFRPLDSRLKIAARAHRRAAYSQAARAGLCFAVMLHYLASPLRNLLGGLIALTLVGLAGVAAYVAHGWSVADALYMVVITVYTVGYGEVRPIDTPLLRLITMALIVSGSTVIIFLTGALVQLITVTQFQQIFGSRRMHRDIDALSNHVVICGYGRLGQMLARELRAADCAFVVIERTDEGAQAARDSGFLCLHGDATDEDILLRAGLARARALATVLPDDAANVFITLSARSLKRDLLLIARGELPSTEGKLIKAGADRVILPARIGAERVAEVLLYNDKNVLRGASQDGERIAGDLRKLGLDLEIVFAAAGSRGVGASIAQAECMGAGAFLVVAIERGGRTLMQPDGDVVIEAGDGVVIVARDTHAQIIADIYGAAPRPGER